MIDLQRAAAGVDAWLGLTGPPPVIQAYWTGIKKALAVVARRRIRDRARKRLRLRILDCRLPIEGIQNRQSKI